MANPAPTSGTGGWRCGRGKVDLFGGSSGRGGERGGTRGSLWRERESCLLFTVGVGAESVCEGKHSLWVRGGGGLVGPLQDCIVCVGVSR